MKRTFFILFACLCSANAARGAEPRDTGPIEIRPLQVEQRVIAEDAVVPVEPVDVTGNESLEGPAAPPVEPVTAAGDESIEEPAPLGMTGGEVEVSVAEGVRDPFDVSAEQAMPSDYSLVAELVNLQGVVKMGNKQMGLFVVTKNRDEKVDFSKTVLRRVNIGEKIRVYTRNVEYTFVLRELGSRSAVIVGENDEAYDIWL